MRAVHAIFLGLGLAGFGCRSAEAPEPVERSVLELTEPAAGAFVPEGDVPVRGVARGVERLTVDGIELEITSGAFSGTIPVQRGVHVIEAVAEQPDGDQMFVRQGVIAGETAESPSTTGAPYTDAALLRVNEDGLDLVMGVLISTLVEGDLLSAAAGTILLDESWGFGSFSLTAWISEDPGAIALDGVEIVATPQANGYLRLDLHVDHAHVKLDAEGTALWIPFDGWITVDSGLSATAYASLAADGGALVLDAGLDQNTLVLEDFAFDTSLTGDILDYLTSALLEDVVRDLLAEEVDALLSDSLDGLLDDLDLGQETELLGQTVSLVPSFSGAGVDEDGLFVKVDLAIDLGELTCPEGAGYLTSPEVVPRADRAADASGVVSDELVNGLLLDLWCAGMIDLEIASDDPDMGLFVQPLLAPLQVTEGTVHIAAGMPPVLVEQFGKPVLQVTELLLTIDTPGRELGEHITVALTVEAELEVGIVDGQLSVGIGEIAVDAMARDSDWGASPESSTHLLEQTLGPMLDALPTLLDIALGTLAGDLAIPEIYGLTIVGATVGREAGGAHLALVIDLGTAPVE